MFRQIHGIESAVKQPENPASEQSRLPKAVHLDRPSLPARQRQRDHQIVVFARALRAHPFPRALPRRLPSTSSSTSVPASRSHVERMPLGMTYPRVVARVCEVIERPELRGRCELVVDATGVGAPVVEMLVAVVDLGNR